MLLGIDAQRRCSLGAINQALGLCKRNRVRLGASSNWQALLYWQLGVCKLYNTTHLGPLSLAL
jgi:hypothetical protein